MSLVNGTPTKGAIIKHFVERQLSAMGVALPGTVVSYSSTSRTATVRPGVHRLIPALDEDDADVVEPQPAIQDVPVCWPCGRGFALADVTLQAGDPVLLICLDRDPSGWRASGRPAEPQDAREHAWGNAVAIPGLAPRTNPIPPPTDAAALASLVDKLITVLKGATAPGSTGGLVSAAFPGVSTSTSPHPGITTGSSILKLGG